MCHIDYEVRMEWSNVLRDSPHAVIGSVMKRVVHKRMLCAEVMSVNMETVQVSRINFD